jgi:hypothetical protein
MANYDAIATRVMRGDFGNGQDRKNRLRAAGYSNSEIEAIQQRVNQMFYGAPVPAAPAPVVDQAAIDRAAQEERDRLAREQADRDRAAQEALEREAAAAAEEQRKLDAFARMP